MLFGFLVTLFIFCCFFLILMILIQQGKGSMGLGSIGGGTQMLFGGSGGQDIFQKITWVLGAIFILGSLVLALTKSQSSKTSKYVGKTPITQQLPERAGTPDTTPQQLPAK